MSAPMRQRAVARLACFAGVVCAALGNGARGGAAAADDALVRELRAELTQLKDRVATLEQQLDAIEQARTAATTSPSASTGPAPATGEAAAPEAGPRPLAAAGIGEISLGGRLKVDAIYNRDSVGGPSGDNRGDLVFLPAAIPIENAGEEDQTSLSARTSRLWLKSHTPTDHGSLATYFEVDFFADGSSGNERVANGYTPRLRHGYGEWGEWLVGQTYTSFMNVAAYPETNDESGPVGVVNVRQPQIRWTRAWPWGETQFAIEAPESTFVDVEGRRMAPDDDRVPDLVGKIVFHGDWGQWSVAGLVREIRADGTVRAGATDAVLGGAVNIGGRVRTVERDNVRFMATAGNAVGRYLAFNLFEGARLDPVGRIDLQTAAGGFVAYQHWWSARWRSNLAVGAAFVDRDAAAPGLTESAYSLHANLLWSPLLKATFGIEWLHAVRELEGGADGELDRLQFTTLYAF